MTKKLDEDQLLAQILASIPLEKAPDNFSEKVMEKINAGEESILFDNKGVPKLKLLLILILGIIVIGTTIFLIDFKFISSYFDKIEFNLISIIDLGKKTSQLVTNANVIIKSNSSMIAIFFAIGGLFAVDRIIRIRFFKKNTFVL
ncbi:MAG: hypothetical protein ACEPOV_00205 [Hyphomicrobiales bacterium]